MLKKGTSIALIDTKCRKKVDKTIMRELYTKIKTEIEFS